jgi:hypothetical protein
MRLAVVVACVGLFGPIISVQAQDANRTETATQQPGNLWTRHGWVHLQIVGGRIDATFTSSGQVREDIGDRHEDLVVEGTDSSSSARYDLITPTEHLSAEIVHGDDSAERVVIRHEMIPAVPTKAGKPPSKPESGSAKVEKEIVELRQSGTGPISFSVVSGGQTRKIDAPSLWHLLIAEPQLCKQHLIPLLESLRTDWPLASTAAEARQQLLNAAGDWRDDQRVRWIALVTALGDQRFAVRERAERELRSAGRAALPYLRNLQRSDLDAEQWRRVTDLIAVHDEFAEDTPESISVRLLGDRKLWFALLSDEVDSTRKIAVSQLAILIGVKVDFDPAADLATRQRQIEALKAKLAK